MNDLSDGVVRGCVRDLLERGDLAACAPLLDRLADRGDERFFRLNEALGRLRDEREEVEAQAARNARRWAGRPERLAAWLDERQASAWAQFAHQVNALFYTEAAGVPGPADLKELGEALGTAKQAARAARGGGGPVGGEGEDYDEGPQQMMASGPAPAFRLPRRWAGEASGA